MARDMRFYTYQTATGAIVGWTDALVKPPLMDGYSSVEGDPAVLDPMGTLYVTPQGVVAARTAVTKMPDAGWVSVDGADPVPVAQAPTTGDHTMVMVGAYRGTMTMTSLATAQAAAWASAKAYRSARRNGGCTTPLGRVQTDEISRARIVENATDATNNKIAIPGWSVAWRMADNSVVAHNALQMVAMQTAVRTFTSACQAASDAIRVKIFAATTVDAVKAIDITAGYPT